MPGERYRPWGINIRILVALEKNYRTYRDVLAGAIQISRPEVDIETIELDALEEKVRNFDPHLVICSLPISSAFEDVPGWVELSLDLSRPNVVFIKGRDAEQSNRMDLKQLLDVLDEVERHTQSG